MPLFFNSKAYHWIVHSQIYGQWCGWKRLGFSIGCRLIWPPFVSGKCRLIKYDQPFHSSYSFELGDAKRNGRDGRFCQWHAGCDTLKDEQIEGSSSPSFPIPCNTVFPTVLHETAFPTKMYPDSLKYSCEIQMADPWETLLVQRGRTRTDSVCEFHGQEPWACCNFSSRWYQIACCDPDYQLVVNFYVPRPAERFQGLWIIILLVCHSFAQTPAYHSQ